MFKLTIITPEAPFYEADVQSVVLPGTEGYLGVLTDHAPLITELAPGKIQIREKEAGTERRLAVSGGFFEVAHNHATVLADAVEEPGRIDLGRAEQALERARGRLADAASHVDRVRAERALWRAQNRVKLAREAVQPDRT